MTLEDGACGRNRRFCTDFAIGDFQLDNAVDQLEVLKTHGPRAYAPLAATRPSMRAHRLSSTKYCSVVALPSLTSCVHCSSGSLIPKALSIAKAMSRKSRLSIPRSLMAWLSGLMESRGMSQVSAIILAMVSNVEDIGNSLVDLEFWQVGGQRARACATAPNSYFRWQAIGSPYSEAQGQVQWRRPLSRESAYWQLSGARVPVSHKLPPVFGRFDRRASATSRKHTVLILAHRGHGIGKPNSCTDQSNHENKYRYVYNHAVSIIVRTLIALVFCQVLDRSRGRRRPSNVVTPEVDDTRFFLGGRWGVPIGHNAV